MCSGRLTHPLGLLTDWHLYALAVLGLAGFVLNQSVYQHGTLAAGIVALSIAEPVVAFVLGVTIFAEHLTISPVRLGLLVLSGVGLLAAIGLSADAGSASDPIRSDAGARPAGGP